MKLFPAQKPLHGKVLFLITAFAFLMMIHSSSAQCIYFKKVVTGSESVHCLGITTDGTLWGWGSNEFGQVGNNSLNNVPEPVQITKLSGWKDIACGDGHSLAIDSHGKLWGWGRNDNGELGDAQASGTGNVLKPVRIHGADSIWKAIAACGAHSMGITTDGKLWVWGYGTLYDAAGNIYYSPIQVGSDTDWVKITTGQYFFIAIKRDSTLWGWGRNAEGEAGDSTTSNNIFTPPVEIDSNHKWTAIAAGNDHTLALQRNGTLWSWGNNTSGELGNGTLTAGTHGPKQVGTAKYFAISAGTNYSLAISKDSLRWAWGDDGIGQFGNDTGGSGVHMSLIPELTDSSRPWANVAAAAETDYDLFATGALWASGDNDFEETGDGNAIRTVTLIKVGTPSPYLSLAASGGSDTEYQRAYTFYATDCSNLIAEIFKTGTNQIYGNTIATVWIDGSVQSDPGGKPYVQRHYQVSAIRNDTTLTGTITLYFNQDEFTAYNASPQVLNGTYPMLPVDATDAQNYRANLRIDKILALSSDGSGNYNTYNGTQTLITPATIDFANGIWEVTFDVTGFGGFFITTGGTLLPVTWINVSAAFNNNQSEIIWKVNEENAANYTVEKSIDAVNFYALNTIASKGNGVNTYQYNDVTKNDGLSYYRIQQKDKDGRINYSSIVQLNGSNDNNAITLFPNPAGDHVFIKGLAVDHTYTMTVYNVQGKILFAGNISAAQNELLTNNFNDETYFIKISCENAAPVFLKFIKIK